MVAVALFVSGAANSYSYVMKASNYVVDEAKTRLEIFVMAKAQLGVDSIDSKIVKAINENDIELAESYYDLSKDLNLQLKSETEKKYKNFHSTLEQIKRISNDIASGIFIGKMKGVYGAVAAIGFEFIPFVGDLRDLAIESKNYLDNGKMDTVTVGLATVGLAIDAPAVMTFGTSLVATTPLNIGVAAIKFANKNKKLTKNFSAALAVILKKSINFKKLSLFIKKEADTIRRLGETVNPSPIIKKADIKNLKRSSSKKYEAADESVTGLVDIAAARVKKAGDTFDSKNIANAFKNFTPDDLKNELPSNYGKAKDTLMSMKKNIRTSSNSRGGTFKDILTDTYEITEATSISTTIKLFKFVDKASDLKKLIIVSKIFGKKTLSIMYAFGKPVFKLIKTVIKITSELFLSFAAVMIGAIASLFTFFPKFLLLRTAFKG